MKLNITGGKRGHAKGHGPHRATTPRVIPSRIVVDPARWPLSA